ncbi:lantibiotic dehydratase [Dyadobacter crusticola]|uniref:lantibiotic dehydratase n=1 Tax=Dyadobacter crusticola TaxID=292407 RepID=UPI0004E229D3|nr:lantibiotic dehydratase [Dyadobacter crusticola]
MQHRIYDFFLLRRPLLPKQTLADFHEKVGTDPVAFQNELIRIFSNPLVQDSLFIASKPLFESLMGVLASKPIKKADRTYRALYKYLIRMSTRCTPFGLFAGCTTGQIKSETAITISNADQIRPAYRLNAGIADQLCQYWQQTENLSSQLLFYPNSSLLAGPSWFRYLERNRQEPGRFTLTELSFQPAQEGLWQRAG